MRLRILWLFCALAAGSWAAVPPTITGATPDPIDAGGPYFLLTITGTGFAAGAAAQVPGFLLATTFISSTELKAAITPEVRAISGHPTLKVMNRDGGLSNGFVLHISPVISAVSPNTAIAGSVAVTVTVTGIGFNANDVLLWNVPGHPAQFTPTFVNSGKMTATIPADFLASATTAGIQIADPAYDLLSASLPFDVVGVPTIASLSPNPIDAGGGGFVLIVNGTGFAANSVVSLAGAPIGTTYVSATKLGADISPQLRALSGSFPITVAHSGIASSNAAQLTVSPVLFSLNTTSALAAGPAVNLTATGAGFTRNGTITFNAAALATTYVNSTTLTAVIPAASLASPGFAAVQVIDSTGTGRSLPQTFSIVGVPSPTIALLSPPTATAGSAGFTLAVSAGNCPVGCVVQWNGTALDTQHPSATSVTANVPPNLIAAAGSASVQLVNQYAKSNIAAFTIYPAAALLTSLNPGSVASGSAAFPLTVVGTGFVPGSVVQWNGAGLPTSYMSSTRVTGFVTADLVTLHAGVSATVNVVNPGGAVSISIAFGIDPPQPTLRSLIPASGSAGSASLDIVLLGANFAVDCVVRWNGVAVGAAFTDSGRLVASVPANLLATAGTFPIVVTNPSGLATSPMTFTLVPSTPVVSGLAPTSVVAGAAAFTVTVTGAYFTPDSLVLWNGAPLATTYTSAAQVTAAVPANRVAAAGMIAITVSNPGGLLSQALSFAVTAAPPPPPSSPSVAAGGVLNAFSGLPTIAPGALISIYGADFAAGEARATTTPLPNALNGVSVSIGGRPAPLLFVSATQINAQAPFELTAGQARRPVLLVQNGALKSAPVDVDVRATAPGILTLDGGHALAVNVPGGALNSAANPVRPGEYVVVYLTGQGLVDSAVASGDVSPADPLSVPLAAVRAKLGGVPAEVAFAGLAPGFVGLLQVNLMIPDIAAGEQALEVTVGDVAANTSVLSVGPNR